MAKGARSNTRKHNNAKLRATVFGPAVDQRTERLSAKLQELSSQPLSKDADMADVDFNVIGMSPFFLVFESCLRWKAKLLRLTCAVRTDKTQKESDKPAKGTLHRKSR